MIVYHFDLYPRDDPRDGARVVRFTKLQSAEYRGEANGTGSGRLSIRADVAEAQLIDPRGLQYVRVVREDTVAETENVVGGFWLETGDFNALSTTGDRLLTFGGAGTLAYLSRAMMASHTYISPIFTGQDPFDDTWRLYAQSTAYANGNFLGAMLWRVIYEAQHNTPGTHRHADGVNVSDTHADDRPAIAIPDLVMDFDQFQDTNGNDWAVSSGEFKAQVGENVLGVVKRLMEAGLYVSMDPDTFELGAWENEEHRRDRTGTTWGASVIYFTRPTGTDITTANIKSDAKRAVHAYIKRSWLLAGGSDVFGDATGSSDVPWEGFYYADVNDASAAAAIAAVQIGARDDAGDTLRLRGRLGTDTSSGYYRPFEDALLDDLVTVKTGTDQFDIDDQDFPIAAITLTLRVGGDWDVWYDLGSAYTTTPSRQFQVSPVPAHNHTLPFCQAVTPGTATATRFYYSSSGTGLTLAADASWNDDDTGGVALLTTSPDGTLSGGGLNWAAVNAAVGNYRGGIPAYGYQMDASLAATVAAGGATWVGYTAVHSRTGIGVDDAAQFNYPQGIVRVYREGVGFVGTALSLYTGTGIRYPQSPTAMPRMYGGVTLDAVPGTATDDWLIWEPGHRHEAPISGATGATWRPYSDADADLPEVEASPGENTLNSWIEIRTISAASGLGNHPELVGTSNEIARCDHKHHVIRDRTPDVTDDGTQGYPVGTFWIYVDDVDNPTEVFATYILVDNSTGAAVWILQADPTPDPETEPVDVSGFVLTTDGGGHEVNNVSASGSAETLDLADGNVHDVTLTDDCAFTFAGATSGVECRFRLIMRQDSTGGWVPTFPASVIWPSATEPTWSADPNEVDVIEFTSVDGGVTWFGDAGGSGTGGGALDDLTDVTITAPVASERLRYNGSQWVNSDLKWSPTTTFDGTNWLLVVDGSGNPVLTEV